MRLEAIKKILTTAEYEACEDFVAFEYEDTHLYLNCIKYFDDTHGEIYEMMIDGEATALDFEETEAITTSLEEQHRQYITEQEAEEKASEYNYRTRRNTERFIDQNFHTIY